MILRGGMRPYYSEHRVLMSIPMDLGGWLGMSGLATLIILQWNNSVLLWVGYEMVWWVWRHLVIITMVYSVLFVYFLYMKPCEHWGWLTVLVSGCVGLLSWNDNPCMEERVSNLGSPAWKQVVWFITCHSSLNIKSRDTSEQTTPVSITAVRRTLGKNLPVAKIEKKYLIANLKKYCLLWNHVKRFSKLITSIWRVRRGSIRCV